MCSTCETSICLLFDTLVQGYYRDFPQVPQEEGVRRPKYIPMDVRNAPKAANSTNGFQEMVAAAPGIGLSPEEFLASLEQRTGFAGAVRAWSRGTIPNGLARKVILSAAEDIIREGGAQPAMTMKHAA